MKKLEARGMQFSLHCSFLCHLRLTSLIGSPFRQSVFLSFFRVWHSKLSHYNYAASVDFKPTKLTNKNHRISRQSVVIVAGFDSNKIISVVLKYI